MSLEHKLLIVENDESLLDLLSRNFYQRGYEVTPVCHPRQALEAASITPFHVALMDGSLPEHDGIWLMIELHRYLADLQVVILSAHCDAEFKQRCLDKGAFAYLQKPCGLTELETTIEAAVEHRLLSEPAEVAPQRQRVFASRK